MTKTTLYTVLCIALRLGAVFLCVRVLLDSTSLFFMTDWEAKFVILAWVTAVVSFVLGFLLWLYPGPLARMAANRASHESIGSDLDTRDLQYVGLSLIGCWLLIDALLNALYGTRMLWAVSRYDTSVPTEWPPDIVAEMAVAVVQVLAGLALLLGARGLSAGLHRLRYGGHAESGRRPS